MGDIPYSTARRRTIARGERTSIPAAEVRVHIRRLMRAGMTLGGIANLAGCHPGTLRGVLSGKHKRMWRRTGNAILGIAVSDAVPVTKADPLAKVPAWRTQRLIAELKRSGVTNDEIAAVMRRSHKRSLTELIGPQRVAAITQERFVAVYRYLASKGRVPMGVLEEIA